MLPWYIWSTPIFYNCKNYDDVANIHITNQVVMVEVHSSNVYINIGLKLTVVRKLQW